MRVCLCDPIGLHDKSVVFCLIMVGFEIMIRIASDIIQNWAFAEQKTVAATISIHTHTHAYTPHFQKLLGFRPLYNPNSISKNIFSDIVYNVKKLN